MDPKPSAMPEVSVKVKPPMGDPAEPTDPSVAPTEDPATGVASDDTGAPDDGEEAPLFIPAGAKPDTLIAAGLTFADVATNLGIDPLAPDAVKQARAIMGTEALEPMTSQEYMFYNTYVDLWEEEPPEGYIQGVMKEMNLKEFELMEKQKAGWEHTPAAKKGEEQRVSELDDLMQNGE